MEYHDVSGLVGEVFWMNLTIVDLKLNDKYIDEYIVMRNSYAELLVTSVVDKEGTMKWLKNANIEIRGVVVDDKLQGVVILYLDREGEIAFFVKEKNKGLGTMLLSIIEDVAKEKLLPYIWAWVLKDNEIAKHVFKKVGFLEEGFDVKIKNGVEYRGIRLKKELSYD